jgi:hypothetical protein
MNRIAKCLAVILIVATTTSTVMAQERSSDTREHDEVAWKELRAAKRDQVRTICGMWFRSWRSSSVGKTYVDLADHYANLDVSRCSTAVKKHVKVAERINTEIAEIFAQGMPDIKSILLMIRDGGVGVETESSITSQRGHRVLELMRELADGERKLITELGLED